VFPMRYGQTNRVELSFKKIRTMDTVQNCDSYINIPWSQLYRSYYVRPKPVDKLEHVKSVRVGLLISSSYFDDLQHAAPSTFVSIF
jgi:hypothetical protein